MKQLKWHIVHILHSVQHSRVLLRNLLIDILVHQGLNTWDGMKRYAITGTSSYCFKPCRHFLSEKYHTGVLNGQFGPQWFQMQSAICDFPSMPRSRFIQYDCMHAYFRSRHWVTNGDLTLTSPCADYLTSFIAFLFDLLVLLNWRVSLDVMFCVGPNKVK